MYLFVAASGWEHGLNLFLDQCDAQEYANITKALKSRLTNLKLFLDLSKLKVLIIDDDLGTMTDALVAHCKTLICCDSNWHKLALIKKRNNDAIHCVRTPDTYALPFPDNIFDIVLVSPVANTVRKLLDCNSQVILQEFGRILKQDGSFLIVRNRQAEKRKQKFWLSPFVLQKKQFSVHEWLLGPPLGSEIFEAVPEKGWRQLRSHAFSSLGRLKHWLVSQHLYPTLAPSRVIIAQRGENNGSTLDKIITEVETNTGAQYRTEKVLFLSSTLVLLENRRDHDNGLIIRIPYSHRESEARCQKNFLALQSIKKIWPKLPIDIPEAVCNGRIDNIHYFVEGRLLGVGIDSPDRGYDRLVVQAAQLSATIFNATKRPADTCRQELETWLASLTVLFDSPYLTHRHLDIQKLKGIILEGILDASKEVCLCHGDFKVENILVRHDGSFSGLIDWDLHALTGVPFLDLYPLLLRRRAVKKGESTMQSIHSILQPNKFDTFEKKIIHGYVDATGSDHNIVSTIGIVYWLHTVTCRMVFHYLKLNRRWFDEYICKPLDTINKSYLS
ncbi:MAG: phosphotransferase [Desulfobulbaceae bacterium]|nr:phosphotransferase [Desulfobulbaceae bacterium]